MDKKTETLLNNKEAVNKLVFPDEQGFSRCKTYLEAFITKQLNGDDFFLTKLRDISCYSYAILDLDQNTWDDGITKLLDLIDLMIEYLPQKEVEAIKNTNKVFIAHGHDNEMKESVARLLETQGLEAVILHEQLDEGMTTFQKFHNKAENCGFAIVLFSPDDWGGKINCDIEELRPRVRQNIILEFGWFLGKLGTGKVVVLFKPLKDFELPTDLDGRLYKEFDINGSWKYKIINEMKAAGFDVSLAKIIG